MVSPNDRRTQAKIDDISMGECGWGGECLISNDLDHARYECIALSLGCSGEVPQCLSVVPSGRVTASPSVL